MQTTKETVHTELARIQANLKAPKSQVNNFGKYKYRSCEDVLESLKPLLCDSHLTLNDDIVLIGDRYYIKATATLSFGGEIIEVSAMARETQTKKGMDEAQITGSASSYARKYALNGLFAIDDNKDPDSTNKHGKDQRQHAGGHKNATAGYLLELLERSGTPPTNATENWANSLSGDELTNRIAKLEKQLRR